MQVPGVDELGFDARHRLQKRRRARRLKRECPKGVDVYFDNVGGDRDAVLSRLALKSLCVICGAISQYNNKEAVKGPATCHCWSIVRAWKVCGDGPRGELRGAGWPAQGKLKSKEEALSKGWRPGNAEKLLTARTGKLVPKSAETTQNKCGAGCSRCKQLGF